MRIEHDRFADDPTMTVRLSGEDYYELMTTLVVIGKSACGIVQIRRGESTTPTEAQVNSQGVYITLTGSLDIVGGVRLPAHIPNEEIGWIRGFNDYTVRNLFGTKGNIDVAIEEDSDRIDQPKLFEMAPLVEEFWYDDDDDW